MYSNIALNLLKNPIAKLEVKHDKKYFQTLEGHTEDALIILKTYILRNNDVINQFCERWSLDKEKFVEALFLTLYFHDIGKLTEEFQNNIKQNKRSHKYPHAYYGFFLLHKSFKDKIIKDVPIELAAILGHHTQLHDQIYVDDNLFEKPTFLRDDIEIFVSNAKDVYRKLNFNNLFKFIDFEIETPQFSWNDLKRARNNFVYNVNRHVSEAEDLEKIKLRAVFSFFFSIIQICDDYSSVNFSKFIENYSGNEMLFSSVLDNPEEYIPVLKIDDCIPKILAGKELYQFQKDIFNTSKFVTLFAPCGRGKTEAALLWALNALKKFKRSRIIFAMPTQTTSNKIYDRLRGIFGEENTGLYHGRSFIKLRDDMKKDRSNDFEEEKDIDYIKSETFKGNVFIKPITITTIDHLLYAFVKGFRQADFALGDLQNSVIIFDEVHYYEKLTLEHLLTLFKLLIDMDIPHLLMSGTLPDFMLKELSNCYEHVIDEEGLRFKPFNLEYCENSIFNNVVFKEIINNYKKGLMQFIILNSVKEAKLFYLKLKEEFNYSDEINMMLYHSQFIYQDRVKKENEIYERLKSKPFLLIATQVIEISLDISCDIMYSEMSPPDAIGQRAGRINRGAKYWKNSINHTLKIYKPENYLPYEKFLMDKVSSKIKNYQKPLDYSEIKGFCDEVYREYSLDIPSNLESFFKKCTIFGCNWKDITFDGEEGRGFMTREEKIQYIDVIPENIYEDEGEDGLKVENMAKIPLYLLLNDIKIDSGYFYKKDIEKSGNRHETFWICRYPYSYELGFDCSSQDENILIL